MLEHVLEGVEVFHHHIGRGLASIVLLSVASAACYGLASVLQHEAAVRESPGLSMHFGLLIRLVRRPRWLVGNALDGVGYLFQFLALRRGSLVLVEPLLVLSLVFALPAAVWLDHQRVRASEWISTGAIIAGVGLFLGVAHPGLGHPYASGLTQMLLAVVTTVICGVLWLGARGGSRRRAAVFLAAGAGISFGYVAALTERTGHLLNAGIVQALSTWVPYGLAAGAVVSLLFAQSAFHAGALRLSLPTLIVAQPLVAVVIGVALFGEHINSAGLAPVFELLCVVLVTYGVFALGRFSAFGTAPNAP